MCVCVSLSLSVCQVSAELDAKMSNERTTASLGVAQAIIHARDGRTAAASAVGAAAKERRGVRASPFSATAKYLAAAKSTEMDGWMDGWMGMWRRRQHGTEERENRR